VNRDDERIPDTDTERTRSEDVPTATTPEAGTETAPEVLSPHADHEERQVGRVLRWVIAALLVALVAYPIVRRMQSTSPASPQTVRILQVPPGKTLLNVSGEAFQAGRYEESIAASKAMLAVDPRSAEAYNNLAVAYLKLEKWDDAIRCAEEAVRLKPDFELAKNNLAWIRQEQARASGTTPPGPAPNTAEFYLNESLRHFQAGRWKECIAAAHEALKLKPDMAEAYNNIAVAHAGLQEWDQAIAAAHEALRLKPDYQLAKNNLAWALEQQQKAREKRSDATPGAPASTRE